MTECVLGVYYLSCLCCLGGGPGIGLITHPGRPSMFLCGQKSMYVIHSLIPSPDRSWLCKAPGGVGHVKVPRRGRLNLDNEMRWDDYGKSPDVYSAQQTTRFWEAAVPCAVTVLRRCNALWENAIITACVNVRCRNFAVRVQCLIWLSVSHTVITVLQRYRTFKQRMCAPGLSYHQKRPNRF